MHSFHRSRARIGFEVLCAFGMSASCAWAWMQTYATAFIPAAAIAALYGLVHAVDLVRRRPAAVETARPVAQDQGDLLAYLETGQAAPVVEEKLETARVTEESELEMAPSVEEADPGETASDEAEHAPIAPLFEPEPFVRTQRAAFGRRKAG